MRIWDGQSSKCRCDLERHNNPIEGTLALLDGRILSWSNDKTLRFWDRQTGKFLGILKGHSAAILGALVLSENRILSWSKDLTQRVWDIQSGACIATLDECFKGAMALPDGRILSWSEFGTALQLWDGQSFRKLGALEEHSSVVRGAMIFPRGRILSWSGDLRLWDGQNGACLAVLEGHTSWVCGALSLTADRILSWSDDKTLRLWNAHSGQCLAVFEGHTSWVCGGVALADGRILSWSWDNTLRLWDEQSGQCLEIISEKQASQIHPEWLHTRVESSNAESVCGDCFADASSRSAHLRHKRISNILAAWNADSDSLCRVLSSDGIAVVTQENGQVCFLKLHHGNRRVSLTEAEEILATQKNNEECRCLKK
jgi:WD40 repeat protein